MTPELEQVTFRKSQATGPGAGGSRGQMWELVAVGGGVFAWAEVFPGSDQWGVRVQDRAPGVSDADLVKLVGKMLLWEVGCPADTVDIVLGRTHEHHTLVRVGGEYV